MTLVLMAVGLLAAAAGLLTIGFGIPINAFSLGNTLIISGTIGVGSGLIVVGLALVHGQLRRIAELLRGRTPTEAVESVEPIARAKSRSQPELAPMPSALRDIVTDEPSRAPESPYALEPRFPATANEPAPGPLDWLRAKSRPMATPVPAAPVPPSMSEPPMVELTDEAPLSPRSPSRSPMPPAMEAAFDPRNWAPSRDAASPPPRAEQPLPRATPQVEPPQQKERFDLVWPDRGAAPAPAPVQPPTPAPVVAAPIEPKLEAAPELKSELKREPAPEMPLPPIPARPRDARPAAAEKRMPELLRKPPAERGPTILKSGVIDGMPYTLYADGSIEAQLPQGMVKFASVDALRAHLEKQN